MIKVDIDLDVNYSAATKKREEKKKARAAYFANLETDCKLPIGDAVINKMKELRSFHDLDIKLITKKRYERHPALGCFSSKSSLLKSSKINPVPPKMIKPPSEATFDQCQYPPYLSSKTPIRNGKTLNTNKKQMGIKITINRLGVHRNMDSEDLKHKRLLSVGWNDGDVEEDIKKKLTPLLISQSSISDDILSEFDRPVKLKSAFRGDGLDCFFE